MVILIENVSYTQGSIFTKIQPVAQNELESFGTQTKHPSILILIF